MCHQEPGPPLGRKECKQKKRVFATVRTTRSLYLDRKRSVFSLRLPRTMARPKAVYPNGHLPFPVNPQC